MPANLKGKTAIITGAGRGIGKAIAVALAENGCNLVLAARTGAQIKELADGLAPKGVRVIPVKTDVSSEKDVKNLIEKAIQVFGGIDLLINNAGAGSVAPVVKTQVRDWDRMMNTNARGAFLCCRETLREMIERRNPGVIINIASMAGKRGYAGQSAYCASKFALMGFSKVLAMEGKEYGVRVHCICPGGVNTEFIRNMRPDIRPQSLIQPEDIAELVVFLATRRSGIAIDEVLVRRFDADVM